MDYFEGRIYRSVNTVIPIYSTARFQNFWFAPHVSLYLREVPPTCRIPHLSQEAVLEITTLNQQTVRNIFPFTKYLDNY